MKYDAEALLNDLENIIKQNLNNKIAEIQAEKEALLGSSNFNVPSVDENAYFDTLDGRESNWNPYVYYGVGDNSPIEIASAEASELSLFFTVVLTNDANDPNVYRKMLRYIRALQEVVSENFDEIAEASNFKITTLTPSDMRDMDGEDEMGLLHKIGGVAITTAIS